MSRAILYLLGSGCAWRALPGDFPKWRTVHSYFQRWSEPRENGISLLEEALDLLRKYPEDLQSLDEIRKPHSKKR